MMTFKNQGSSNIFKVQKQLRDLNRMKNKTLAKEVFSWEISAMLTPSAHKSS